jgi:hypothetical protein
VLPLVSSSPSFPFPVVAAATPSDGALGKRQRLKNILSRTPTQWPHFSPHEYAKHFTDFFCEIFLGYDKHLRVLSAAERESDEEVCVW